MRNPVKRFFTGPQLPTTSIRVILWWELRRIPFNVIVGAYGIVCLVIFFWGITGSGILKPGEDAVEPLALLAAPFGVNALYTFGWLIEVLYRAANPMLDARFGPRLFGLGLGLGLFLITIPAAMWGGYRILQLLGDII